MKNRSMVVSFIVVFGFLLLAGFMMFQSTPTVAQQSNRGLNCIEVNNQIYLPQIVADMVMTPSGTVTPSMPIPTCFPVPPPVLVSPSDGAVVAMTTFDWSDVSGATEYIIELSETAAFTNSVWMQAVNSSDYEYQSDLDGVYYWRVAVTAPGISTYSDVWAVELVDYNGDADGDELRNGWELHGYDYGDNGTIDIDLSALGANYDHKDIFVEMDYMVRPSAANGLGPNQNVMDEIVAVFADAPVSNPDGVDGINIHLDLDEEVPYDYDLVDAHNEFLALMNTYFEPEREAVYFYMIWANRIYGGTSSGNAFGIPNNYFVVSLGGWNGNDGGTDDQKIGTFIHELGHNLGLTHGGVGGGNYKPNYLSVMNYSFQVVGVYRDASWGNFDYQRFPISPLNENALNETLGLNGGAELTGYGTIYYCPNGSSLFSLADSAINWNCDGDNSDSSVAVDINNSGFNNTLASQDNWVNIVFNGGGVIGSGLGVNELQNQEQESMADIEELTFEMFEKMQHSFEGEFEPEGFGQNSEGN